MTNKHQKADQEAAIVGKFVYENGGTYYPAVLPASMGKTKEAVDATRDALINMTDMERAERSGIAAKAMQIIHERNHILKPLGAMQLSIVARLTSALAKVTPIFTVYEHPSAPNVYLVYVPREYVVTVGDAMIKWITDPAIPPYVAYQVSAFGSDPA